mmetsp:Transcript_93232/g.164945  ORF Transcript_93232/g.164945 Transcript_93232/m.164945 type:complete len:608 (+) Transcript_93232:105-1928(+)
MTTLYELLGAPRAADHTELRAAYRRRVLEVHPDKGGNIELCQQVMAAYAQLIHPQQRREYDTSLARSTAACSPTTLPKARRARAAEAAPAMKTAKRRGSPQGMPHRKRSRQQEAVPTTTRVQKRGGGRNSSGCSVKGARAVNRAGNITKMNLLLARIVSLLRKLDPDQRRDFISQRLTEGQRLALEAFMRCMPEKPASPPSRRTSSDHSTRADRRGSVPAADLGSPDESSGAHSSVRAGPRGAKRQHSEGDAARSPPAAGRRSGGQRNRRSVSGPNSTSTARLSEELKAARKIAPGARGSSHGSARGAARVRGIIQSSGKFHAQVGFAYFTMRAKWRKQLTDAVEDYAMLIVIKLRLLEAATFSIGACQETALGTTECSQETALSTTEAMRAKLQAVLADAFTEQGIGQAELGLRISVSMPTRYAHYLVGRNLCSPCYSVEEWPSALHTWLNFQAACEEGPHTGGRGTAFRAPPGSQKITERWQRIRCAYIDAWAERGADRSHVGAELDSLMEQRAGWRQQEWEMVEAASMAREERQQRAHERQQAESNRCRSRETALAVTAATARSRPDTRYARAAKQGQRCLLQLGKLADRWASRLQHSASESWA